MQHRFARVANTYNAHSALQYNVAQWLCSTVLANTPQAPQRILEVGCGTGVMSRLLAQHFSTANIVYTDAQQALLHTLPAHGTCGVYNLNHAPPALVQQSAPYNLIIGNLVLHWCNNPLQTIAYLRSLLAPSGQIWLSAPLPQSTPVWAARVGCVLPHMSPQVLQPVAQQQWPLHTTVQHYAGFLRGTGATGHAGAPLAKSVVRGLLRDASPLHDTFIAGAWCVRAAD